MQSARKPENEVQRIEALESYNVLDTLPEQDFDDITTIAARICNTSIALVSLVDRDRQWFKSKFGIDADETPRDVAFCAHAILDPEKVFVVPDAHADERFHDNPLVTGGPKVRFYGGAPLVDADGNALGTLCVIDHEPKELTAEQIEALDALSRQVVGQMELRKTVRNLQEAQDHLSTHAEELVQVSRHKSEFLANMSHELRTPLNSLLILAKMLAANKPGNMNEKQVQHAGIIHRSGSDLLDLINDILDLSKVEAGRLDFNSEETSVHGLLENLQRLFQHVADEKDLCFELKRDEEVPETFYTDAQRLQQVLKNLLANAFKFTRAGRVEVHVRRPKPAELDGLKDTQERIAFAVSDSGIGIPEEKQAAIFEAFQQAEGSTSRTYGGTGLGLSIAREFSQRLGGTVRVTSEAGKGSCFTVLVSAGVESTVTTPSAAVPSAARPAAGAQPIILIVEDDEIFNDILANFARERGFDVQQAFNGQRGLELARSEKPHAILLDVQMPLMSGYRVKEELDRDPELAAVPVHFISALEPTRELQRLGYAGYLTKPVTSEEIQMLLNDLAAASQAPHRILIVEDDLVQQMAMRTALEEHGVESDSCTTAHKARDLMRQTSYDLIILDLELDEGETGFQLLDELERTPDLSIPPVVVYTAMDLDAQQLERLHAFTDHIVSKQGTEYSKLMNTVETFIGQLQAGSDADSAPPEALPPPKVEPDEAVTPVIREPDLQGTETRPAPEPAPAPEQETTAESPVNTEDAGTPGMRRVLLVDDDVRNVFALSAVLEDEAMEIEIAQNGLEALEALEKGPDYDIVLMDIMMPVMDGYEAMSKIREQERFRGLPIIALTAKAMVSDRESCLEAGATEYISKPVDVDLLLETMGRLITG